MPAAAIKEVFSAKYSNIITEATIEGMAERFGVSKAAMEVKLAQYEIA